MTKTPEEMAEEWAKKRVPHIILDDSTPSDTRAFGEAFNGYMQGWHDRDKESGWKNIENDGPPPPCSICVGYYKLAEMWSVLIYTSDGRWMFAYQPLEVSEITDYLVLRTTAQSPTE